MLGVVIEQCVKLFGKTQVICNRDLFCLTTSVRECMYVKYTGEWYKLFRKGQEDLEDDKCAGHPSTLKTLRK